MNSQPVTLSAIAGLEAEVKGAGLSSAERERARQLGTDAMEGLQGLASVAPFDALESILRALAVELRVPLADILKEGWKQDAALRAAIANGEKNKTVRGEVALHKHTISATLEPTAELLVNDQPGPKLHFEVKLSILVDALILVIRDASITALKAGKLTVKLELAYISHLGGSTARLPLMDPRTRTFATDTEFPLPLGGLRIV